MQPVPVVLGLADRMGRAGALPSGSIDASEMPAHEIRFDAVAFNYPSGSHRVLDGFDLTIPAGRSIAIVGQNGAGKTTLAKLLCRMYDPTAGAVLVDGVDLRELDLASWRSRIAAVFQDFVRYELSLRENVAPGGASDDDVRAALARHGTRGRARRPRRDVVARIQGRHRTVGWTMAAGRARARVVCRATWCRRRHPR